MTTDRETCPTCWQPVTRPQRGDHDYGIPLVGAETAIAAERARVAALMAQASSDGLEDGRTCLPTSVVAEILEGGG